MKKRTRDLGSHVSIGKHKGMGLQSCWVEGPVTPSILLTSLSSMEGCMLRSGDLGLSWWRPWFSLGNEEDNFSKCWPRIYWVIHQWNNELKPPKRGFLCFAPANKFWKRDNGSALDCSLCFASATHHAHTLSLFLSLARAFSPPAALWVHQYTNAHT